MQKNNPFSAGPKPRWIGRAVAGTAFSDQVDNMDHDTLATWAGKQSKNDNHKEITFVKIEKVNLQLTCKFHVKLLHLLKLEYFDLLLLVLSQTNCKVTQADVILTSLIETGGTE